MEWQKVDDYLLSVPASPCRNTAKGNSEHLQRSDPHRAGATCTACSISGGKKTHPDVSEKAGKSGFYFQALLLCSIVDISTTMLKNSSSSVKIFSALNLIFALTSYQTISLCTCVCTPLCTCAYMYEISIALNIFLGFVSACMT